AARLGLDQPIPIQYFSWLSQVAQGYLGESFAYKAPVAQVIRPFIFNSMSLVVVSILLTWIVAVPFGVYSAVRQYSLGDKLGSFFTFFGLAIPRFFFILVLIALVFRLQLPLKSAYENNPALRPLLDTITFAPERGLLFPTGGMRTIGEYDTYSLLGKLADRFWHLILPAVVIATSTMAGLVRVMRGQMLEFLRSDFIRTARAKGLAERTVIYKHALRNAITPFIAGIGGLLPELIGGAGLVEFVYRWPGITPRLLDAITTTDVYMVMGFLTLSTFLLMIGNLISDLLLAVVDPRIRYS
ncbi:MAG: ABC transporter permease, partial [Deinococcus sp.]|nr:ABC transporter permease [Deinococcus sp.]